MGPELAYLTGAVNTDGGWGFGTDYDSSVYHSALAVSALNASGSTDTAMINSAVNYLTGNQNPDGSFGYAGGAGSVYLTAVVLDAIRSSSTTLNIGSASADAAAWLLTKQNPDGGFGEGGISNVYETAICYRALFRYNPADPAAQLTLAYIEGTQLPGGSWNSDLFETAMALIPQEDSDADGLPDYFEITQTGTNTTADDTDGDGITDDLEDLDFDGRTNAEELAAGTDPKAPDVDLGMGFNLFTYPVEVPVNYSAFDLLLDLGTDTEVEKVQRYNPATGLYETADYVSGAPAGVDFPVRSGEGYIIYMFQPGSLSFPGKIVCPQYNLNAGLNILGVPCSPPSYLSTELLVHLGTAPEISSVQGFAGNTGRLQTSGYLSSQPSGETFTIHNGAGYLVHMYQAKTGVVSPILPPSVAITSPADGSTVYASPITVTGTVDDPSAVVKVNGVFAAVVSGIFTASGISLTGGANTIIAEAASRNNLSDTASISVILDLSVDYIIPLGGTASGSRIFTAASSVLDQVAFYTETQSNVPAGVVYTTTGVSRISATEMQINFAIDVQPSAVPGIYNFQVTYGLLDVNHNPLGPLTGNVFSFRIQIVP